MGPELKVTLPVRGVLHDAPGWEHGPGAASHAARARRVAWHSGLRTWAGSCKPRCPCAACCMTLRA